MRIRDWSSDVCSSDLLGDGYRCAQPFCVVGIFPRACPFPALGEQRQARHHAAMRYWWVNQNQTYRHEVPGGYLWSPKRNRNGGRNPFYDFMREVAPGDVVFSFSDTYIKAIGIAGSHAYESPKPREFGQAGAYWRIGRAH